MNGLARRHQWPSFRRRCGPKRSTLIVGAGPVGLTLAFVNSPAAEVRFALSIMPAGAQDKSRAIAPMEPHARTSHIPRKRSFQQSGLQTPPARE